MVGDEVRVVEVEEEARAEAGISKSAEFSANNVVRIARESSGGTKTGAGGSVREHVEWDHTLETCKHMAGGSTVGVSIEKELQSP